MTAAALTTNARFLVKYVIGLFAVLIVANSLLHLIMIPHGVVSLSGRDRSSKKLLKLNYVFKSVCIVLTCMVLSANIAVIYECINKYQQRDFFEEYKDYYWYNSFSCDKKYNSGAVVNNLYNNFYDDMNLFCIVDNFDDVKGCYAPVCSANSNTKDYLAKQIDGFDGLDFKERCYVLVKKGTLISGRALDYIKSISNENAQVFYYKNNAEIVVNGRSSVAQTSLYKNPVIVYFSNKDDAVYAPQTVVELSMMKNESDAYNKFAEKHSLVNKKVNVLEYYENQLEMQKRTLYINLVLSAVIIMLEILVTSAVIRLEYSVNAAEIAIKKICGYTNFERFSSLYIGYLILWGVSTVAAMILSKYMDFGKPRFIFIGAVAILICNLIIFIVNTSRYDKLNIQKILKGGAL